MRASNLRGTDASPAVFRFAPSPNGDLHLGHVHSAFYGFLAARRMGGRFLLRIEDIDVTRTRPEYVAQIFEDLTWLGLRWDEPVLHQSAHFPVYQNAAGWLERLGLLYPCFATRSEIAAATEAAPGAVDPDGVPLYPGLYKTRPREEIAARRADGEPFALRLDMERALVAARGLLEGQPLDFTETDAEGRERRILARPDRWGDAIIVRKDVPASYHLAVVVDDARQGVTHITRGQDLFAATDLHRLLQVLLGLPEPVYSHHGLITDEAGRKLSKSARDTSVRSLREAGASAEDVRKMAGISMLHGVLKPKIGPAASAN